MQSRTALITGSTDGLGGQVARRLAEARFTVLIHGRNRERAESVVRDIRAAGGSAFFHEADLASLEQVRRLAEEVMRTQGRLDLLINNAGIGTGGRGVTREVSVEGYELRFAVNYLAGFLLTHRLVPLLKQSVPSRVVSVASAAQYPLDFGNVMLTRAFSGMRAYAQSKLAQVMFTFDLARELAGSGVTVNCLHPASLMDTRMVRESGMRPTSSVDEGSEAVVQLALSPELQTQTGLYFDATQPARAHDQAYDEAARLMLRTLSRDLVGLPPLHA